MSPTLTDAAAARWIRRLMAAPSTTSDTLLIVADGLDEWAQEQADATITQQLREHAAALRTLAPHFAPPRPTRLTPLHEVARAAGVLVAAFPVRRENLIDMGAAYLHTAPERQLLDRLLVAIEVQS